MNSAEVMTAGKEFKEACLVNGMSAFDVAEKTGISVHTIHSYWQGTRYPSRKNKRLLAERLCDVNVYGIFNE